MNLAQQFSRIEFLLNRTRSSRIDVREHLLQAINLATDEIVQDRVGMNRKNRGYSFESNQRIKDELRTLVVPEYPITPVGQLLALPADYWYDVGLRVVLDGVSYTSDSSTFNEEKPSKDNLFKRPVVSDPQHLIYGNNIKVMYGGGSVSFTKGYLDYIRKFNDVALGSPITATGSITEGVEYYVEDDDTVYNGISYQQGGYFTGVASAPTLTAGTVAAMTSCELPSNLHEEINARAVVFFREHSGDVNRLPLSQQLAENK